MDYRRYKKLQDAIDNYNKVAFDCKKILRTKYALYKDLLPISGMVIFEEMLKNFQCAETLEKLIKIEYEYEKRLSTCQTRIFKKN